MRTLGGSGGEVKKDLGGTIIADSTVLLASQLGSWMAIAVSPDGDTGCCFPTSPRPGAPVGFSRVACNLQTAKEKGIEAGSRHLFCMPIHWGTYPLPQGWQRSSPPSREPHCAQAARGRRNNGGKAGTENPTWKEAFGRRQQCED